MKVKEGRRRVVIERVRPEVDCGRFPAKRTVGERVIVEADVFTDGHDAVGAALHNGFEWLELLNAVKTRSTWP